MRAIIILACSLFVLLFAGAAMADQCPTFCTFDYTPVCGEFEGEVQTFGNQCAFDVHKCQHKPDNWSVKHVGACDPSQIHD